VSIEATVWAFEQNIESSERKFVLVVLADNADACGVSQPRQETLSQMTGQSEQTVRQHLWKLELAGLIRRVPGSLKEEHYRCDAFQLAGDQYRDRNCDGLGEAQEVSRPPRSSRVGRGRRACASS